MVRAAPGTAPERASLLLAECPHLSDVDAAAVLGIAAATFCQQRRAAGIGSLRARRRALLVSLWQRHPDVSGDAVAAMATEAGVPASRSAALRVRREMRGDARRESR